MNQLPTMPALSGTVRSVFYLLYLLATPQLANCAEAPQTRDERLVMELFAAHPQIVTPTGIDVDAMGRVFVAESHTHFRPDDYEGPKNDRILILEDTDRDGKSDKRTVFHQGFTHIMDIEFNRDGWLYVATRMDIHRLRDTNGNGRADKIQPVVVMKTTGTYPHNGLSGLAFDFDGRLNFGLGENLGHVYTLTGSDGGRVQGGGEGGSTYHVKADGTGLHRVSTGWWNPWGLCVDSFGRVFGTDNDPGASPPCRLIQVVDGADYGYEYRYGRTGLHPLITWTGDIPGTLPMIAGTGEAPCAIVAYESDALPEDYLGDLIVASWADHRIERYQLTQNDESGLLTTGRQVLFEGDNEFRPVGVAIAPDGTIYVSDWVSSSYALHQQGRIWRIRPRKKRDDPRPLDPRKALWSFDRRTRETAARELASDNAGRAFLRQQMLESVSAYVRATSLRALSQVDDELANYARAAGEDPLIPIRVLALRHLISQGKDPATWSGPETPAAVRAEAVFHLDATVHTELLAKALSSSDPLVFHAAVDSFAHKSLDDHAAIALLKFAHPLADLLSQKRNAAARMRLADKGLANYLSSANLDVRYAAIKWIADDRLTHYRADIARLLNDPQLDHRLFLAASAALDRLDGKQPTDYPSNELLLSKITDENVPASVRAICLRLIDPKQSTISIEQLGELAESADPQIRLEAVRTLAEHPNPRRFALLVNIATDSLAEPGPRAAAIAGLAAVADQYADALIKIAVQHDDSTRDEALRCLVGVQLTKTQRDMVLEISKIHPSAAEAVNRLVMGTPATRPAADDIDAWLELVSGRGDAALGERVFLASKVATCALCHQHDGRGNAVGPPLTMMSKRLASRGDDGKRWLLETILDPSKEMAPEYSPWTIITTDGKTLTGLPRRKGGNAEAYLGLDGEEFVVRKQDIQSHRESSKSVMPDGLLQNLTIQEMRDLFAFLMTGR